MESKLSKLKNFEQRRKAHQRVNKKDTTGKSYTPLYNWTSPNIKPTQRLTSREVYPRKAVNAIMDNLNCTEVKRGMTQHYEHLGKDALAERVRGQQTNMLHHCLEMTPFELSPKQFYECEIDYFQNGCMGRLFAEGSFGYASMPRAIRHSLAYGLYDDLDIVNCHPVILHSYVKRHKDLFGETPCLDEYISNREPVLERLMREQKTTRTVCKTILLSLMNGGKGERTLELAEAGLKTLGPTASAFKDEMLTIQTMFYEMTQSDKFPELRKYTTLKQSNEEGSTLNLMLVDMENQILRLIVTELHKYGHQVDTLCFDGCMVRRRFEDGAFSRECMVTEDQMRRIEEYVLKHTGFPVRLEIKPFKPTLNIAKIIDSQNPDLREDSIIQTFHEHYGEKNIYINGDRVYSYDERSRIWKPTHPESIGYILARVMKEFYRDTVSNKEVLELVVDFLSKVKTAEKLGKAYYRNDLYQADLNELSKFNRASPYLLPYGDKVIDLKTGKTRLRNKEDYFTYSLKNRYLPDADLTKVNKIMAGFCMKPVDDDFVDDEDTYKALRSIVGYAATGLVNQKCMFFLLGPSNTGKSFFNNFLSKGLSNETSIICNLHERIYTGISNSDIQSEYEILETGARIGFTSELQDNGVLNAQAVKRLTGADPFQFRPMRSSIRSFKNIAKLFVGTNEIPSFKVDDTGLETRLLFIPFENTSLVRSKITDAEVDEMKDLIFTWIIKASIDFCKTEKLHISYRMQKTKKEESREKNPLNALVELYEETKHDSEMTPPQDLWDHYRQLNPRDTLTYRRFLALVGKLMPNSKKVDKTVNGRRVQRLYCYRRKPEKDPFYNAYLNEESDDDE